MDSIFIPHSEYLEHHGIKGQKWGLRRYQNSDGSLTDAGKKRYARRIDTANSFGRRIMPEDISDKANQGLRQRGSELRELQKKRNEPYEMEDKFWKDTKLVDKYASKYADDLIKDGEDPKERDNLIRLIKYDDVGQNLYQDYYLKDHKEEAKNYNNAVAESSKARSEIKKIEKEIVNDLVGVYGDKDIMSLPKYGSYKNGKLVVSQYYTVSDVLQDHMDDLLKDF